VERIEQKYLAKRRPEIRDGLESLSYAFKSSQLGIFLKTKLSVKVIVDRPRKCELLVLTPEAVHHLGASRCKCVPIEPIILHGFILFLYRVMPKIGSLVAKINKHLQRDVTRWCIVRLWSLFVDR